MNTKWVAMSMVAVLLAAGSVRADDPNPDVAKAIQEIDARRAEKVEARVKQVEAWANGESNERRSRGGFNGVGGAQINPAPGQTIRVIEKK